MKSLVKKGTKKDTVTPEPKEPKGKEKVTDVIAKQDMRKLLPRKLTRTTPNSLILDSTRRPVEKEMISPSRDSSGGRKERKIYQEALSPKTSYKNQTQEHCYVHKAKD